MIEDACSLASIVELTPSMRNQETRGQFGYWTYLNSGACGSCFRNIESPNVVLKKIGKARNELVYKRIIKEAGHMLDLSHTNVMKILKGPILYGQQTDRFIFLVLEFAGEPIGTRYNNVRIPESHIKLALLQVSDAVKYLHGERLLHRDIRQDNVTVSGDETNPVFKIIDFGLSAVLSEGKSRQESLAIPDFNPIWASPERNYYVWKQGHRMGLVETFQPCPVPSYKSDVWMIGIFGLELLCHPGPVGFMALYGGTGMYSRYRDDLLRSGDRLISSNGKPLFGELDDDNYNADLAEMFRSCNDNFIRLCILRVMLSTTQHHTKINSREIFLRPVLSVTHSNDGVARSIALRLLGVTSVLYPETKSVLHAVIRALDSYIEMEREAALFACKKFAAVSQDVSRTVVPKLKELLTSLSTTEKQKVKILDVLRSMHLTLETGHLVRGLCLDILSQQALESVTVGCLQVLTHITLATRVREPALIRTLSEDPRERVRSAAVQCLKEVVVVQPALLNEEDVSLLFNIILIPGVADLILKLSEGSSKDIVSRDLLSQQTLSDLPLHIALPLYRSSVKLLPSSQHSMNGCPMLIRVIRDGDKEQVRKFLHSLSEQQSSDPSILFSLLPGTSLSTFTELCYCISALRARVKLTPEHVGMMDNSVVDAAFQKLAEMFRSCNDNFIRLCILRVMLSTTQHHTKINSREIFLRPVLSVTHSNDGVARSIALRLLGVTSVLYPETKSVLHAVIRALDSYIEMEREAALFACKKFAAVSQDVSRTVVPKLKELLTALSTTEKQKVKILDVLRSMHLTLETGHLVRGLCLDILSQQALESVTVGCLQVLTHITLATRVREPALIRTLSEDPRERVRSAAVQCLKEVVVVQPALLNKEDVSLLFNIILIPGVADLILKLSEGSSKDIVSRDLLSQQTLSDLPLHIALPLYLSSVKLLPSSQHSMNGCPMLIRVIRDGDRGQVRKFLHSLSEQPSSDPSILFSLLPGTSLSTFTELCYCISALRARVKLTPEQVEMMETSVGTERVLVYVKLLITLFTHSSEKVRECIVRYVTDFLSTVTLSPWSVYCVSRVAMCNGVWEIAAVTLPNLTTTHPHYRAFFRALTMICEAETGCQEGSVKLYDAAVMNIKCQANNAQTHFQGGLLSLRRSQLQILHQLSGVVAVAKMRGGDVSRAVPTLTFIQSRVSTLQDGLRDLQSRMIDASPRDRLSSLHTWCETVSELCTKPHLATISTTLASLRTQRFSLPMFFFVQEHATSVALATSPAIEQGFMRIPSNTSLLLTVEAVIRGNVSRVSHVLLCVTCKGGRWKKGEVEGMGETVFEKEVPVERGYMKVEMTIEPGSGAEIYFITANALDNSVSQFLPISCPKSGFWTQITRPSFIPERIILNFIRRCYRECIVRYVTDFLSTVTLSPWSVYCVSRVAMCNGVWEIAAVTLPNLTTTHPHYRAFFRALTLICEAETGCQEGSVKLYDAAVMNIKCQANNAQTHFQGGLLSLRRSQLQILHQLSGVVAVAKMRGGDVSRAVPTLSFIQSRVSTLQDGLRDLQSRMIDASPRDRLSSLHTWCETVSELCTKPHLATISPPLATLRTQRFSLPMFFFVQEHATSVALATSPAIEQGFMRIPSNTSLLLTVEAVIRGNVSRRIKYELNN
eukprot:sb/3460752/